MNDDSSSRVGANAESPSATDTEPSERTQSPLTSPEPPAPQEAKAPPRGPTTETARGGGWRQTFSSLKNRNFLYLWLGMLAMMGGLQMQMFARGYLVYDMTGSPFLLGLVSAGFALPMLSLALFGGVIADRLDRRRVIQMGQGWAALMALFVAISIATDTVTWIHLFAVSMLQGALFSFLMPARQAIIPQIVGRDQITNAIALQAAGMSITTLVAPTVAGLLYAWKGPDTVYFVVTGMSGLAVLLTGMIPTLSGGPVKSDVPMLADIRDGFSYIRRSPLVLVLLAMGLATALLAMPFRFLMPIFVVDVYGRGPEALGLLVTVMGAGSLAGSLFIAGLGRRRRGMLLIAGSFVSAIALGLVALIPFYYAAAAIMLMMGLGDAGRRTLNMSLIMEEVPDEYRGRVMSVFMMNFGLMPLGVLPIGLAAEFIGGQASVGILAVLLLLTTTVVLVTQKRLREAQ